MKLILRQTKALASLPMFFILTSCSGQIIKDFSKQNPNTSEIASPNQQVLIKSQSTNAGDNVNCSIQDKKGNLWFGTTADGIYKYDGKWFTQITMTHGLNSNTVWCILEDKSGKLWIGTSNGVCLFEGEKFTKIQIDQPNDTIVDKYDVWSIIQDKSGKLWFATQMGVFVYDGKSFTPFTLIEKVNDCYFRIERILEDKAGNFWFGGRCHQGVFCYNGKTITHHKPNGDEWAWPVLQDKKGNIWFSNWKGAYRYDGESYTSFTKKDGLSGDLVARIKEDKKGNLWFGGDGLTLYDGKSFICFSETNGLLNRSIWSILEDNSGNFWIGTRETGLYLYDGKSFTRFSQ